MKEANTDTEPLYSVVVANYNRGRYIAACIKSVLGQTYQNLELIIVDDGSTDNSRETIREYALKDKRLIFHDSGSNRGCGSAMWQGATMANGDYMGYLGSDDTLSPDAVETVVKGHLANPLYSIIYTSHYVCDEDLVPQRLAYGAMQIPVTESYLTFGKGITSFASINLKYYRKTEGVNPTFKRAVDQDLYYKLEEKGPVLFIDKPVYNYRVNNSGISTGNNIAKARYWFAKAKENAFLRRTENPGTKNISRRELEVWWSIVYVSKANVSFRRWELCKGFYWLGLSARKSVIDNFFLMKLKSLFMNSSIHRVSNRISRKWNKPS